VLVNGIRKVAANGTGTWQPRDTKELATLRDLVQSTIGFDPKRGDVITIRSLPFEALPQPKGAPKASLISSLGLDPMTMAKLALMGILALLLGLFVLRPILAGSRGHALAELPPPALDGEIDSGAFELQGLPVVSPDTGTAADGGAGEHPPEADPVARLRKLIAERQDETVDILRSWMEEGEKTA